MQMSQMHYLPLTPGFFSILVGLLAVVILLVQLGLLRFAFTRLGVGSGTALLLLVASLVGAYFNRPIAELPGERVLSGQVVDFFGMRYVVPVVREGPGTLIAVNIGGAVIPTIMSIYLLFRYRLWGSAAIAITVVAAACYWLADPVPGVGIAIPIFVPAAATAIVALLLSREYAAALAYIAGSLGTLIGADLMNLDKISGLGAPVASIGGAGAFDGIFVTGIVAVLLASLTSPGGSLEPGRQRSG